MLRSQPCSASASLPVTSRHALLPPSHPLALSASVSNPRAPPSPAHTPFPLTSRETGQALAIDPTTGDVLIAGLEADMLHHIYRVTPSTATLKSVPCLLHIACKKDIAFKQYLALQQSRVMHQCSMLMTPTLACRHVASCGYVTFLSSAYVYDYDADIFWLQYGLNQSGNVSVELFGFQTHTGLLKYKVR